VFTFGPHYHPSGIGMQVVWSKIPQQENGFQHSPRTTANPPPSAAPWGLTTGRPAEVKVGEGPPEEGPTERDPRDAGEATPGSVTTGDPVAPRCGTHGSVRRVAPMGGYVLMLTMQRSKKN